MENTRSQKIQELELNYTPIGFNTSNHNEDETSTVSDENEKASSDTNLNETFSKNNLSNSLTTTNPQRCFEFLVLLGIISLGISLLALTKSTLITISTIYQQSSDSSSIVNANGDRMFGQVFKLGFGSCTAYDLREMSIYNDAIIPSKPDAWIWVGDIVYLDDNTVNCELFSQLYGTDTDLYQKQCNCSATWMQQPPHNCEAGDLSYANSRWMSFLNDENYNAFLNYMCPRASELGYFPPRGLDAYICDKPIYGIYDDHDYGANNLNKRLPNKSLYKEMYLDAIGEDPLSIRRNKNRGAWMKYTMNQHLDSEDQIDLFVLDERYERDTIGCSNRRDYCNYVIDYSNDKNMIAWCLDFLRDVDINMNLRGLRNLDSSTSYQQMSKGSCCSLDEDIFYGWCLLPNSNASEFYDEACNISSEFFGHRSLVLDPISRNLRLPSKDDPVDSYESTSFCDVLGREQRKWLRTTLPHSKTKLKIVVSSSVLLDNPLPTVCATLPNGTNVNCTCSADNLDCYPVAQKELLHILSSVDSGCVIVLTGDFHFSDIKQLKPGKNTKYSDIYNSFTNKKSLYQVMSSGMSTSTGVNYTCADFRLDPLGLRTHPECDFVRGPNFGMIEFTYDNNNHIQLAKLQIRGGTKEDDIRLETVIDANTCMIT